MTTITAREPEPNWANKDPGHAPVMAQPRPNINPPYTWPLLNFLFVKVISSPLMVLIFSFLIKNTEIAPTTTAVPITDFIKVLLSR